MKKFMLIILCFGNIFAMEPASPSLEEMRAQLEQMRIETQPLIEETLRKLAIPEWTKRDQAERLLQMHQAIKDGNLAGIDKELLPMIDSGLTEEKIDVTYTLLCDIICAILDPQEPKKYLVLAKAKSTPLSEAIKLFKNDPSPERLEIIKFLLARQRLDVRVSPGEMSYLHVAIKLDLPEVAGLIITETLKRYGPNSITYLQIPAWRSQTPLHYACARFDLQTVKALIDADVNVQPQDFQGKTPLHFLYDADYCPVGMDIIEIKKISQYPERWKCFKQNRNTIFELFRQKGIILAPDSLERSTCMLALHTPLSFFWHDKQLWDILDKIALWDKADDET